MVAVLKVLCPPTVKTKTIRKTVYDRLNRARSNFLHGDDITTLKPDRLMHFGAILYRLMLTEFLGLHRKLAIIPGRGTKPWAERMGKEMAEQRDYESYQDRYEEALATFLKPRPDPRANHRRVTRPA